MDISATVKTVKSVITANSPILLVGAAVTGIIATGVLAAKGGYKARGIIDAAEEERGEVLTVKEKAKLTWLCYAIPALTGASAIASVAGVHTIHTKRHAALAGLYAIATNKLDDYTEKAEEMLGVKKTQQLNDAVAQKAIDRGEFPDDKEVLIVDDGTQLCYDDFSGRYFMGSLPKIQHAFSEINHQLESDDDTSVNDFYDFLGLSPITMGGDLGWACGTSLDWIPGAVTSRDGRPAISIAAFRPSPTTGYNI